jgi:hypothetical protein
MDNSIIDVSGQSFNIPQDTSRQKVPYWRHQYVYAVTDIEAADKDQRRFYKTFKTNFLNDIYMDIEGNSNYAFILLFDLLDDFDRHNDFSRVRKLLLQMALHYPETKRYCTSLLVKKLEDTGKLSEAEKVRCEDNYHVYEGDSKIGTKYRPILQLTTEQAALLNKLGNHDNNFFNHEFCGLEIVKLYLSVVKWLNATYKKQGSSLEETLTGIADIVCEKHFKYKKGNSHYNYFLEMVISEFYTNILKHCENKVRECYLHKRKLHTDIDYTYAEVKEAYHDQLLQRLQKALNIYAPTIAPPERGVELELNSQNPQRWKVRYEEIATAYKDDPKEFVSDIVILGNLNKRNPSVGQIFYEASKFIVRHDKLASLKLYIYYLHYDLRSVKFDNKPIAKTIQKTLFDNNEQLHAFQAIVSAMIKDKNLDKALNSLNAVYAVRRRKININPDAVQRVREKHSGTVELLNEYLKDEYADETNTINTEEVNADEVVMQIASKSIASEAIALNPGIRLNAIQCEMLSVFVQSNLSVHQNDAEAFARTRSVFKNQLIDSMNEACYEVLDDLLIEEDDEYYVINNHYYQKILAK